MRIHQIFLSLLVLFTAIAGNSQAITYIPGHLLVRADPHQVGVLEDWARSIGVERKGSFNLVPGLNLYKFDERRSVEEVRAHFLRSGKVLYAEPDYVYNTNITNIISPNDQYFSKQYALDNTGQTGGSIDADINAPQMWEIQKGSNNIVIATIDTGIDYTHPDLVDNLWKNPGEVPNNNKDDDNNGYIDDVYGINTILNTGDPMDDNVHGTHVAGTIGASGDNTIGVVGVAQHVKIASCKFLSQSGSGGVSNAIKCMDYFAALKSRQHNPVNIVATNNSWGGGGASQALLDAIKAHEKLGILFIAAAGNSGENNDNVDRYPCNYPVPNVIAVAATDSKDMLANFSSYGKKSVHVAAPGVKILSTVLNKGYGELSGTSMATPHVAGLAAVIAAQYPAYSYQNIKNLIMSSGQLLTSTQNATISGRRIRGADSNGQGALTCENQLLIKRLKPESATLSLNLGSELFLSALGINCAESLSILKVSDQNAQPIILQDNGQSGDLVASDGIMSFMWRPNIAGVYVLNFGSDDSITVKVNKPNAGVGSYKIDDTISYEYENIQGDALGAQDDTLHKVTVPFFIKFNNDASGYSDLYVSSNGTVGFSNANPGPFNTNLPWGDAKLVAPLWDDLAPGAVGSDLFTALIGEAPHRRFIIEWLKFRHYAAPGESTFQAIFYEDSADIKINYLSTNFADPLFDAGRSATVGIQTGDTDAVVYSYNQPALSSNKSILFRWQ
jgi:subtilisin family serine protease